MEHDATDILGQDTMPSASRAHNALFSLSLGQFIGISVIFFAVYAFGLRLWRRVLLWRERSYKLATRRRHGIPDSDMRPFNVAYAEASMRAREESGLPTKPGPAPLASVVDLREASYEQNLRNRSVPQRPEGEMRSTVIHSTDMPPGGYLATPAPSYSHSYAMNSVATSHNDLYPNLELEFDSQSVQVPRPLSHQQGYYDQEYHDIRNANGSFDRIEDKKRPLDDSMDEEHNTKKSRVDEDALMDSDVDADEEVHKRGAKRGPQDDADDHLSNKKNRGKRARNGERIDTSMDVDSEEGDEVTELRSIARGKKRDRAEAGSDDEDSMDEANGDSTHRRHRKRRTVSKRKSEASYQRGKKRDRGSDDEELSDGNHSNSPGRKIARTKRGKRTSNGSRYAYSVKDDVSMDGSTTSGHKNRRIGDEWEIGGIRYKLGDNHLRLRQALVKKARHRFLMPQDSQHPDRQEHLQVYVETWLTEEEYKEAKDQHLLAWQDEFPRSELKDNLTIDITENSNIPGKSLLWGNSTTTTPTLSPSPPSPTSDAATLDSVKRGGSLHPLAVTPTAPAITHIPTAKRIASATQVLSSSTASSPLSANVTAPPAPGLSDSTNAIGSPRTPNKAFSKWEKQELEARAMMKIREANKRKEMEREAKIRAEREASERAEEEKKRQRQERERVEREQREASERARKEAQEKANAEKKAKEAADAAQKSSSVPKITVTAPSTGLGSQPSQSGTPASAVPPGTTGATLFAMPSNLSATPSPFSAPKPASTTPSNPFASSAPVADKLDAKSPASSGFSFGPPPSTTATNTSAPAPSADAGSKIESQGATSGNPLFARLGMPAVAAATSEPAKPASNPLFSFANSKPSTFTAPTPSIQTTAGASADSTATTTPKFNFGFGAKPAAPTTGSTNSAPKTDTPAIPGLGTAFGSNTSTGASGTTASSLPFSFKVPEAPSSATSGSSLSAANSGFNFGSTPSAFGTTSVFPNTTPAAGQANTAAKSPFGTPSPFGTGAESKPSPFGASATQTQNGLSGAAVSKPGEAKQENKPFFSFANPVGSAASSTPSPFAAPNSSNTTAAKPSFSFGAPPTANTTAAPASTAPAAPKFSFNFGAGAAATPSTTTSAASPSPFSSAPSSGQNVFGGGMFGASAANPAQK